jgi:DNA-directed RNA polymerase specialized sigma24 family protein
VGAGWPLAEAGRSGDPAEEVAVVARAKRELLLRVHRHRLRAEDLEDCYGQATLELVAHVGRGGTFADRAHLANALELRFLSRVRDRRRALAGRSPMQAALETAVSLGSDGEQELAIVDVRAEVEKLVMLRHELRRVERLARELTPDQRLVLAYQLALDGGCRETFCSRFGWSTEKYRKVAQRARARLRSLMEIDEPDVPPAAEVSEGGIGTCV